MSLPSEGKYHEQIEIADNATGFGFERVFGRFIDEWLSEVEVLDPYIRTVHQVRAAAHARRMRGHRPRCAVCLRINTCFGTGATKYIRNQEAWGEGPKPLPKVKQVQ